ncbi:hypothetical protein N7G274_002530 [Stereocaulon virgatum]|uniref:Uncharacterized protein n=1 Tax=Stereocaulon virgatum TaxID=373712 RepID=A0ABR4AH30_9LECA
MKRKKTEYNIPSPIRALTTCCFRYERICPTRLDQLGWLKLSGWTIPQSASTTHYAAKVRSTDSKSKWKSSSKVPVLACLKIYSWERQHVITARQWNITGKTRTEDLIS